MEAIRHHFVQVTTCLNNRIESHMMGDASNMRGPEGIGPPDDNQENGCSAGAKRGSTGSEGTAVI